MPVDPSHWLIGLFQNAGWDFVKAAGGVALRRIFKGRAGAASIPPGNTPEPPPELKFEILSPSEQTDARLKALIGEVGKLNLHDQGRRLIVMFGTNQRISRDKE